MINEYGRLTKNYYNETDKIHNQFYLLPNYNTLQSEIISSNDSNYFNKSQSIGSLLDQKY